MTTSLRERPPADRGVADATGPLLARQRRSRRRLVVRLVLIGLVLVLLGAAGWLVGFSSVFAAERVTVRGTDLLTPAAVIKAADVPLGTPLARIDLAAVSERVEAMPAVASVAVERGWPDTVVLAVTERTPVLAVGVKGARTLVDADGVAFATVDELPADLPVAEVPLGDRALLRSVATVSASLPLAVRRDLQRIDAASAESIKLELSKDRTVVWGSADQSPVKSQVLVALLTTKARVYDVSGPANPTTRG